MGHNAHDARDGYKQLHITDREEMSMGQQHKLGNIVGGYQTQSRRGDDTLPSTNREQIGQNRQDENIMNVSRQGMGNMQNVNSYRTDPTNREQTMSNVSGNPGLPMGHTTELSSMNAPVTGRESTHEQRFGGAGSSNYQAGMSYESLLKTEGYSLRAATDENRMSNPGRTNVRDDPEKIIANLEQKMESNAAREGNIQNMNNTYQPIANPEIHPNKVENINPRFDTSVLDQLKINPFVQNIAQ